MDRKMTKNLNLLTDIVETKMSCAAVTCPNCPFHTKKPLKTTGHHAVSCSLVAINNILSDLKEED